MKSTNLYKIYSIFKEYFLDFSKYITHEYWVVFYYLNILFWSSNFWSKLFSASQSSSNHLVVRRSVCWLVGNTFEKLTFRVSNGNWLNWHHNSELSCPSHRGISFSTPPSWDMRALKSLVFYMFCYNCTACNSSFDSRHKIKKDTRKQHEIPNKKITLNWNQN